LVPAINNNVAAPAPGKNFDAAPALTLLYIASQLFENNQMLTFGVGLLCPLNFV
jgi:hypothetical protein